MFPQYCLKDQPSSRNMRRSALGQWHCGMNKRKRHWRKTRRERASIRNRSDCSPNWTNITKPISILVYLVCESCSGEGVNDRNAGSDPLGTNRGSFDREVHAMTNETPAEITRTCFVVMGFGKKTDFETGRTLDLDKSYRNIIKPAVEIGR